MNAHSSAFNYCVPRQSKFTGTGGIIWRRSVTLIALAVLAALAYKAYFWYTGDVARRTALTAGREPEDVIVAPPRPAATSNAVSAAAAPMAVIDFGSIENPDQRRSVCGFLVAELERLGYEFRQPLPPPVIDRVATEIEQLRAQTGRYGCAPSAGQPSPNTGASSGSPNAPPAAVPLRHTPNGVRSKKTRS